MLKIIKKVPPLKIKEKNLFKRAFQIYDIFFIVISLSLIPTKVEFPI